jgi:hypothetical protein
MSQISTNQTPLASSPNREEFQTFGLETINSYRKYMQLLHGSESNFLEKLDLSPREAALLRSELVRSGICEKYIKILLNSEFNGSPLYRPFQTFNSSSLDFYKLSSIKEKIANHNYLRSVEIDHGTYKDFPSISTFNATIREVPRCFLPRVSSDSNSISLLLQLPQEDWEQVIKNCSYGPFTTLNSLAHVRIVHRKNNYIEILEIASPHYDSLCSTELKERYKDWSHILMRAVIDYAAHSRKFHASKEGENYELLKADNQNSVKIIFPSPRQIREVYKGEKECGTIFGAVSVYDENIPDKVKHNIPPLSLKDSTTLYRRLPLRYGFKRSSADFELSELSDEKFKHALVREVTFVKNKGDQDPIFHLKRPSPRIRHWLDLSQNSFERVELITLKHQPLPIGHPVYPKPKAYVTKAVEELKKGAELTPCLRYPESRMPCSTPTQIEKVAELQSRVAGMEIFRSLLPDGFTVISKGIEHGANSNWWEVPKCEKGEIGIQFIHIKEQNRHPALRVFIGNEAGKNQLLGSYGFKGGGVGTLEGVNVSLPTDRRLPIYHRLEDVIEVEGKKVKKPQYPCHQFWGGQHWLGALNEYHSASELALFCDALDPRLAAAIAVPISVERLLSIPSWKKDGQVEWHDPVLYTSKFMRNMNSDNKGFFQTITFSKSDVRLAQLVGKIFGMNGYAKDSVSDTEDSILEALRFLYHTYDKEFSIGSAELLPSSVFGMRDIGKFLKELGEQNHKAANEIYADFEFRTVATLAAVHGGDGNLGGVFRRGAGIMFGGPQSIRNIDLFGCMHDYETRPFLPWSTDSNVSEFDLIKEHTERNFMQGADALLLRESLYWLKSVLFGFESDEAVTTSKLNIDSMQDITVMTAKNRESADMISAFDGLKSGVEPEKILCDQPLIELYRKYKLIGRELADKLTVDPW